MSDGGTLVAGQLLHAVHTASGGGGAVRAQSIQTLLDVPEAVRRRVGDVENALSADKYALVVALSQEDPALEAATVYLGLSDVAGARVGRWVFVTPTTDAAPERIWWHATWRTRTHFVEWVGWVPSAQLHAYAPAMRTLEASMGTLSGWRPGAALLWTQFGGKCEGPAAVNRMAAISATTRYAREKQRVRGGQTTPSQNTLSELRLLGRLIHDTDTCIADEARNVDACTVDERDSTTERSRTLQQAVVTCLENQPLVADGL